MRIGLMEEHGSMARNSNLDMQEEIVELASSAVTWRDKDALCVVCRSPRTSLVMIPGRSSCYPGWILEYRSYEPAHEFMALFVLRKFILQTRVRSHPVGLDV